MPLPLLLALGTGLALGTARNVGERRRAEAAQEQRAGDARASILGEGLGDVMAGPRVGVDPAEQQQVAAIQRGLMSPDVNVVDNAQRQLEMVGQARGLNMTPRQQVDFAKAQVDLQKSQLELTALQNPSAAVTPEFISATAGTLFTERKAMLAPYATNLDNFDQLAAVMQTVDPATGQLTAAGGMATLFKFIQGLDNSVVRNSETGMLTGGMGLIGDLVERFNRAVKGGMSTTLAKDIYDTAAQIAEQQLSSAQRISTDYDARIARYAETFMAPSIRSLVGQPITVDVGRSIGPYTPRKRPGSGSGNTRFGQGEPVPESDEEGVDYDMTNEVF